ncbi:MAG: F-type H+-transporting ATPase subunit a [Solirubrobacteraceae bacterium]|jgi:F-type H+-transporting ATPase subunit a|nr:F-type H+-transporting ATPase subunit a [Solirubrobacteraceae bacterium]
MEHEHSILYAPFNAIVEPILGFAVPDHVIMALLVLLISCIAFPIASRRFSKDNPGGFQQFLEIIVNGLKDLLEDIIGHGASKKFLYIIGGFACFIFVSNLFGLFFFLQPPTGNPNTTFGLGLTAFLYYNWQGIRAQGLGHYLKHFMGPMPLLAPLMLPIEIIGHLARVLSLGMRLFGNIFGEHTATGIFMGMLPFVLPWPMMGLGIFGAFLQTFVFIMLTMVYIGGAVAVEEH